VPGLEGRRRARSVTRLCDACHGTGRVTLIERDALLARLKQQKRERALSSGL
jgi:hypothetical protein